MDSGSPGPENYLLLPQVQVYYPSSSPESDTLLVEKPPKFALFLHFLLACTLFARGTGTFSQPICGALGDSHTNKQAAATTQVR